MKEQKSQSQKPRRRSNATAKRRSRARVSPETYFKRVEELYQSMRKSKIRHLRTLGYRDPEAIYHEAFRSVLRRPDFTRKGLKYLPKRIRSRLNNAMKSHGRYRDRFILQDEAFWATAAATEMSSKCSAEIRDAAKVLLSRLPRPVARLLKLHHLKGKTYKEISRMEGVSVNTVKSRIRRGLLLARKILLRLPSENWMQPFRPVEGM